MWQHTNGESALPIVVAIDASISALESDRRYLRRFLKEQAPSLIDPPGAHKDEDVPDVRFVLLDWRKNSKDAEATAREQFGDAKLVLVYHKVAVWLYCKTAWRFCKRIFAWNLRAAIADLRAFLDSAQVRYFSRGQLKRLVLNDLKSFEDAAGCLGRIAVMIPKKLSDRSPRHPVRITILESLPEAHVQIEHDRNSLNIAGPLYDSRSAVFRVGRPGSDKWPLATTLGIEVRQAGGRSRQLLWFVISDKNGHQIAPPVPRTIEVLREGPLSLPGIWGGFLSPFRWIWPRVWTNRAPLSRFLILGLLLPAALIFTLNQDWVPLKSSWARSIRNQLRKVGLDPVVRSPARASGWTDEFFADTPLDQHWIPGQNWTMVDGVRFQDPNEQNPHALLIEDEDFGRTNNYSKEEEFYDFKADFFFIARKDQRSAVWIPRVRNEEYFAVRLELPENDCSERRPVPVQTAKLEAYHIKGDQVRPLTHFVEAGKELIDPRALYKHIRCGDQIDVSITAQGDTFLNSIKLTHRGSTDTDRPSDLNASQWMDVRFQDRQFAEMSHGGFGFGGKGQEGQLAIESFTIQGIETQ